MFREWFDWEDLVTGILQISQWYKVVIFTASMAEYADPVIDWLDQDHNVVSQRYFRQVGERGISQKTWRDRPTPDC